ncbi:conserved hypothetical protein [Talaromyces stipitatus ATCC 10500]|uniref:Uncharacterized protein n=1 Tax=Talaromyces stipitatus (strain ATCC 10500 / CBS 375.48 / QM 6759 / NRRL 1006) TaxID=441959 RepID=B8LT47_TALSN|nr:uncharacterized protein TSTA_069730 [Talaromyces stipitatus ATCC 10500]EED23555.1 conserved hypothetical protein [Talaromyces stipitatus ATCC 10500]
MNGTISRFRFQCMNIRDRLVHTPWLFIKTVIRGITAALAVISLSFFAAAIPCWNHNLEHIHGPEKGDWQDGIPIAPLALAFLYNTCTTIYAVKKGKGVPYHILEVLIDFLILSALAAALVFAIWGGVFNVWSTASTMMGPSGMMMVMCDESSNAFSRECFPELYPLGLIEIAAIGFAVPVW